MSLFEGAAVDAVKALNLGALEAIALQNLDAQSLVLATALDKILQARIAQLVDELKGALIGRTITITIK